MRHYTIVLVMILAWIIVPELARAQTEYKDYICYPLLDRMTLDKSTRAAALIHKTGCETGTCTEYMSGVLLNNTARNGRLLFLTYKNPSWTDADYQNATVAFNWQLNRCGGTSADESALELKSGHSILYKGVGDDVILLELKKSDANFVKDDAMFAKLFFAGWKTLRNPASIRQAYMVHHGGDTYKKMSFTEDFDHSAFTGDQGRKDLLIVNTWSLGKEDGHSMGAPLLTSDGLVLGINVGGIDRIQMISPSLQSLLDPLNTESSYILGSSIVTATVSLRASDYRVQSDVAKIYYFPNQQWNSSVDPSQLLNFNIDKYFLEKNTLGNREGVLATALTGASGTARIRIFHYLEALPKVGHPDGNTVRGVQLYASGSKEILTQKYYSESVDEDKFITIGDVGLLTVAVAVIRKAAPNVLPEHIMEMIRATFDTSLALFFTNYLGDLSKLGIGKFTQDSWRAGLRYPTNRPDEVFLVLKVMKRGFDNNIGPVYNKFIDPFPGTDLEALLQLELENSACTAIAVPGLGKYNAVELFEPERFRSMFSSNTATPAFKPNLLGTRFVKGTGFDVKRLIPGVTFGKNDEYTISSISISELIKNNLEFTSLESDSMFLCLNEGVRNQEFWVVAKDESSLEEAFSFSRPTTFPVVVMDDMTLNISKGQTTASYKIFRVTPSEDVLFIRAGIDGPFLIAPSMDIRGILPSKENDIVLNRSKYSSLALVAAQRGYSQEPGVAANTTKAFQRAIELDADAIELDIAKTNDGVYVPFHDDQVFRITDFSTPGITIAHFNWNTSRNNVQYKDENGVSKTINLPALNTLKLKDRFGILTDQRIQTLKEALKYLAQKKVFVTLDKVDGFMDDIYKMVLQVGMENNVLFKGGVTSSSPGELETRYGTMMKQINFNPVFVEEAPNVTDVMEQYVRKELAEGWTISGFEPQVKTDLDHLNTPAVSEEKHKSMLSLVKKYNGLKWIGMSSITPSNCGDNFLRSDCPPGAVSKDGCANYDWRADPDFCIDYVKSNYFITDRPDAIIGYLQGRNMH